VRILSVTAASRLAEQLLHEAGGELTHDGLLDRLEDLDVDRKRGAAGFGQAIVIGRLQAVASEDGPVLRVRPLAAPAVKEAQR